MSHTFYTSGKWKRKRETVLRRDEYKCRECKRYGKTTEASTVHHVIPLDWCVAHEPRLALDARNLVSLCLDCHNRMHNRMTDELTACGLRLAERIYRGDTPGGWLG